MHIPRALLVLAGIACAGAGGLAARAQPHVPVLASRGGGSALPAFVERADHRQVFLIDTARPGRVRAGDDGLDRLFASRRVGGGNAALRTVADLVETTGPIGCSLVRQQAAPALTSRLL